MINRDHPAFKKEAEPFYNIGVILI